MFNFFKRDPAREKQKIPVELFAETAAGASNACNILGGAGLKGKFDREKLFSEICGSHVKIVISTMSRVDDCDDAEEKFDNGARFLLETLPGVFDRLKDPKIASGLVSQGFAHTDLALLEKLLIADETFTLAASYYMRVGLDVSDEDVLDFGKKYNPKLLTLSSNARSHSIWAYIIRCVRLSHLEEIPDNGFRTSVLTRFNDTLAQFAVELEKKVEKLIPRRLG